VPHALLGGGVGLAVVGGNVGAAVVGGLVGAAVVGLADGDPEGVRDGERLGDALGF